MTSKNNRAVTKENVTRKGYTYNKGNITLAFTLRNDIKQEMKDFLELMAIAKKEIEEDLAKLK